MPLIVATLTYNTHTSVSPEMQAQSQISPENLHVLPMRSYNINGYPITKLKTVINGLGRMKEEKNSTTTLDAMITLGIITVCNRPSSKPDEL